MIDDDLRKELAAEFSSPVEPVRKSVLYRLGAMLVAFVMVLLPAIYFLIVAAVAYGVYYHATHSSILRGGPGIRLQVLLYFGPLVIGAVLVVFMARPFIPHFGKRKEPPIYTADRTREPDLWEFVGLICKVVNAPMPKRINVVMGANACASFRHGLWSLFRRGDLELTIGMPLLQSFNVRQLAGVIAHEMGHFSQGTGMRLSYVIASVHEWFMRAVYGGGEFDEKLQAMAGRTGGSIALIMVLSRLFVFLTRLVLYVFMMLGFVASNFLSRQMEYDADLYQIRVAGSRVFESTMYAIVLLSVSFRHAFEMNGATWQNGVLVNDLGLLATVQARLIARKGAQDFIDNILAEDTRLFDTHPSPRDRVACAKRLNVEGVCRSKTPATVLCSNPEVLPQKLTRALYCYLIGVQAAEKPLLPVRDYLEHFERNKYEYTKAPTDMPAAG